MLFQVRPLSREIPRYFVVVACGIWMLFKCTGGHSSFLLVNVTWTDFASLILIFHFCSHVCNSSSCLWSIVEAASGFSWLARIAVSFANVAVVASLFVERSVVYSRYRSGPMALPCGTPA